MSETPPIDDDAELLVAEATDDFLARAERGENPDIDEHAGRYPAIADMLRELLPAMRLMHRFRTEPPASPASPIDPVGTSLGSLGDFKLLREIGRGGMGVVYVAEQISLNRHVALKVLPLAAALDPRQLQRFRLEAQAAAHLHHSNIVPIYSVGCERGVYYYAMQFIEGRSLADVIAGLQNERDGKRAEFADMSTRSLPNTSTPLAPTVAAETNSPAVTGVTLRTISSPAHFERAAEMGIQAAEALDHAHSMGVVHRDVKPANLLIDAAGTLFVTDFGLARLEGDSGLTRTGDLAGTLRYMSPEQTLAQRGVIDHRTDIYSLGVTLYEWLTLSPAIDAQDRHSVLRQIAQDDPIAPRRRNPNIPADLETIVLKAMAKEPQRRYATAKDMADDFRRYLDHRPILARRPSIRERAAKWARRHRAAVTAGVVLLVLAAFGFAVSTALIAREQWRTQAAYNRLAEEQERTKAAYKSEAEQRERAEKSFRQAREIVDFFTEVSEEELADKTELQGLRRMLLAASLDYYRNFIDQSGEDLSLHAQLAKSHLRVASILDEIGSRPEALAALERARQLQEKLVRHHPSVPELQMGFFAIYTRFGFVHGGRELHLLGQKAVQDDLVLTEDQVRTVGQFRNERLNSSHDFRDLSVEEWSKRFERLTAQETALSAMLTAEQTKRLQQIALQLRGGEAFSDPEIARALALTDVQEKAIDELHEDMRRSFGQRPGERREWKRGQDPGKWIWNPIWELLTEEQKAKWSEMTGPPLKGRIAPMHRWGGGFRTHRGPDDDGPHDHGRGDGFRGDFKHEKIDMKIGNGGAGIPSTGELRTKEQ